MNRMQTLFLIATALTTTLAVADTKELIEQAKHELEAARSAGTAEAYKRAEQTMDLAVQQDATNAVARAVRGAVKMEYSGWLAQKGNFAPANEVMTAACSDLDAAVAMDPKNLTVRLTRGLMYGRFPTFFNKGPLAKEDLTAAIENPQFSSEKPERKAQAHLVLGDVYMSNGDAAKASAEFLAAVDANPDGEAAKEARRGMKKLAETASGDEKKGPYHPDRFPKISADMSPIIAVASITISKTGVGDASYVHELMEKIKAQPGLLGTHVLRSEDRPGMLVIMTWWKDKQALNGWFYSDSHQGVIRQLYVEHKTTGGEASQVAIELLTPLPGGMRLNGGLAPDTK